MTSKKEGAYTRFPRILPVLFLGFLRSNWVVLRTLLVPVLPNQCIEMDLEVVFSLVNRVLWVLLAKARNKHARGRLVPWVGRRSLQMKPEVVGCAGNLVAY